jgi:hypothetical protein
MAVSDQLQTYIAEAYPQLGALNTYLTRQFSKLQNSLRTVQQVLQALDTTKTPLLLAADDPTAASLGVPINGLYHTSTGSVRIRLS